MKIKLKLDDDFIEELNDISDWKQLYAALWMITGVKPIKKRENGYDVHCLGENAAYKVNNWDIYKLGYVQALIDMDKPVVYDSKLPLSQEFIGRALDAFGMSRFNYTKGEI